MTSLVLYLMGSEVLFSSPETLQTCSFPQCWTPWPLSPLSVTRLSTLQKSSAHPRPVSERWGLVGAGWSWRHGQVCPGRSSRAPSSHVLCRGVPVGFWQLSKAVSSRNSCLKEIAKPTAFGKSALVLAISSFPKASPRCPEKTSKEACVFPDISRLLERETATGSQVQCRPV